MSIRKKTHIKRQQIVMPRYGTKNIIERLVLISLPHITFLDGPFREAGAA